MARPMRRSERPFMAASSFGSSTPFRQVPKRIVLDIDDTFDAYHDEYGFQPIVVFDGDGRFVAAVLRPAKRPKGSEIRGHLRRLVRAIRSNWPGTSILIRGDSHYCGPAVIDWCRANGIDFILGVASTSTLRRHIETLEAATKARFEAADGNGKMRRFKEFVDGAASWSRVECIIARVEAGDQGTDTRFIVTNLTGGKAKALYQDVYCQRGIGREPHQILEDPSGRRSHLVQQGDGQPVPSVPPRRCLLVDVGIAHRHAKAVKLAGRAVRHLAPAPAPHQNRCPRGRVENSDPASDAHGPPVPGYDPHRPHSDPASDDVTRGAQKPRPRNALQPQDKPNPLAGAGDSDARRHGALELLRDGQRPRSGTVSISLGLQSEKRCLTPELGAVCSGSNRSPQSPIPTCLLTSCRHVGS